MKKAIFAVASIFVFSSLVYAGGIPVASDTVKFTFKPSNNVGMTYFTDDNKQNYVANSKHQAGNRLYSSSNNSSNIWFKESATYVGQAIASATGTMTTPGESTYDSWSSQ